MPKTKNASYSASGSKSKNKGIAQEEAPAHREPNSDLLATVDGQPCLQFQRFRNVADLSRFASQFAKAKIHVERSIVLADFDPSQNLPQVPFRVYHWIHNRGWDQALTNHYAHLDMVREFYCFASIRDTTISLEEAVISHVRDTEIVITKTDIRDFYYIPRVAHIGYPYVRRNRPDPDIVFSELIGHNRRWGQLTSVPTGFLDPDYRILYNIFHGCFKQNSNHSSLHKDDSDMLYAIGTGVVIDLADYLYEILKYTVERIRGGTFGFRREYLPLGSFITQFLKSHHVPQYMDEATTFHSDGDFNYTSWKRSLGSKKPYVPAADPLLDPLIRMTEGRSRGAKGQPVIGEVAPGAAAVDPAPPQQQAPPQEQAPPPQPAPPIADPVPAALRAEIDGLQRDVTRLRRTVRFLKQLMMAMATAMNVPYEEPPPSSDEE